MRRALQHGAIAGMVGAITIWIFEYIVQVPVLHQTDAAGVVQHTALLVFGPGILAKPISAFWLGAIIHCLTGIVWGVIFATAWPSLAARRVEAMLAALFFGAFAWVIMHNVVLAIFSPDPPIYTFNVVLLGMMSHMVAFAVPLAWTVKILAERAPRT